MKAFGPIVLAGLLAGCATAEIGESVYTSGEVGVPKQVERCRVIAVREITIRDEDGDDIGGAVGGIAGGIAGGVLGNEVGEGSGRAAATALGALAGSVLGAVIGTRVGDTVNRRPGLEYSILKQGGQEITFAQEILPGDRMLRPGETCRVQVDPHGYNRVLPVEGLPPQIARPETTTFY